MKALIFLAITLVSGAIAGTILGIINQGIVEPYIDRAINIETQNAVKEGEVIDSDELIQYRIWQKGGEIIAGTILGTSIAALFGIIFAYSRSSLPGSNNKKKALVLVGIMWFVLFIIPALKYPANPPAVGDPETIYYREALYISFLAISGITALALAYLYRKLENKLPIKKITIPIIYTIVMVIAFITLPPNPDKISAPIDLVQGFRVASAFTMSVFWGIMGIVFGSLWDKLRPNETTSKISIA